MSRNFPAFKKTSIYTIARREHFRLGVSDYRSGAGWREIEKQRDALDYERGRQFAACYSGRIYRGFALEEKAKVVLLENKKAKILL